MNGIFFIGFYAQSPLVYSVEKEAKNVRFAFFPHPPPTPKLIRIKFKDAILGFFFS